jgi:hypothetical protein
VLLKARLEKGFQFANLRAYTIPSERPIRAVHRHPRRLIETRAPALKVAATRRAVKHQLVAVAKRRRLRVREHPMVGMGNDRTRLASECEFRDEAERSREHATIIQTDR